MATWPDVGASRLHAAASISRRAAAIASARSSAQRISPPSGSISDEQLLAGLIAAGVPKPFAELGVAIDANTRAGKVDLAPTRSRS